MSYACPKCGHTFAKSNDLKRHLERKISCDGSSMKDKVTVLTEKVELLENVVKTAEEKIPAARSRRGRKIQIKLTDDESVVSTTSTQDSTSSNSPVSSDNVTMCVSPVVNKRVTRSQTKKNNNEEKPEEQVDTKNTKAIIMNLVNALHNTMRNRVKIIGQKAFDDISRLLLLRFMEPHLQPGGHLEYMLDRKQYINFKPSERETLPTDLLKFSVLATQFKDTEDFMKNMHLVWELLYLHEVTDKIFARDKFFNCNDAVTLGICVDKIYKTLKEVSFDQLTTDIKGEIYESFVNGYSDKNGKQFGQFFTPRNMIHKIIEMNKKIFPEMKVSSIYDPCVGTGGFLMEMHKIHQVKPDQIYGGEISPDTFVTSLMNLILSFGSICSVKNHDSLSDNKNEGYDWIATNPPLGMKGLNYQSIIDKQLYSAEYAKFKKFQIKSLKEIMPIPSNDGSVLFLQHCISKLNNGGVCNIVLPDGNIITGKQNSKIRKYLVESVVLRAILQVPGGVFTHAGVKTCVLFFQKLEGQKTTMVDFYETDKNFNEIKKVGTVDFTNRNPKDGFEFSWNRYKPVTEMKLIESNWEIKTLGEICELIKGQHSSTKTETNENGVAKFITVAKEEKWQNCDIIDGEGDVLFISNVSSGKFWPIHFYSGKFAYCDLLYKVNCKGNILPKFVYYYLINSFNNQFAEKFTKGCANLSLDKELFYQIQIPVPSIEKQQEIIERCSKLQEKIHFLQNQFANNENIFEALGEIQIKSLFESKETKALGEISTFLPSNDYKTSMGKKEGKYRFYNSSINNDKPLFLDTCEIDKPSIIIGNGGSPNVNYDINFTASKHVTVCQTDETKYDSKYMYMFFKYNMQIFDDISKGATMNWINRESLGTLKIPIPSIEKQQEIIQKCEEFERKKIQIHEALNKQISETIEQAKQLQKNMFVGN